MLARQLLALGHPAWLLCRPGSVAERLGREWQVPTVAGPAGRLHGYVHPAIFSLAAWLRRHRIQIIHSHWSRDLTNLLLAAHLGGRLPVVLTKHVYSTQVKRDPFHSWLYRRVAAVIAVSRVVAANLLQTTRLRPEKIVTIYPGLDVDRTWNPQKVHPDLRRTWGVPRGAHVIGYAGRLNEGKGPHLVLEAFVNLAPKIPDWHLVLVGRPVGEQETAYADGLKAEAARRGLAGRIHFPGYCDDMPAAMQAFDLLVCASRFESLGMVLVEAMAMAKPVVGPDAGGVLEIITAGANGELFRSQDAADLTVRLKPLLASRERRERLGRAGRRTVLEKFDLKKNAQACAELYRRLLGR